MCLPPTAVPTEEESGEATSPSSVKRPRSDGESSASQFTPHSPTTPPSAKLVGNTFFGPDFNIEAVEGEEITSLGYSSWPLHCWDKESNCITFC